MLIGIAYHPYQIPKFRLCQIYIYIKIISNISKLYQIPSLDYKLHKHKDYVWSFSLKFCFFSQLSNNYWWFINVCWMNKCGFGGKRLDNICNSHIKEGLSARLCCQLFGKNQLLIRVNFLRCVPQHLVSWLTKKVAWIFFFNFICGGFCHTLKWNSHGFTCVPHPNPSSHLPLHPLLEFLTAFPPCY